MYIAFIRKRVVKSNIFFCWNWFASQSQYETLRKSIGKTMFWNQKLNQLYLEY